MNPITANPTAQAPAIRIYSAYILPRLSGLLQRVNSLRLSFAKSLISVRVELTIFGFSDIFIIWDIHVGVILHRMEENFQFILISIGIQIN